MPRFSQGLLPALFHKLPRHRSFSLLPLSDSPLSYSAYIALLRECKKKNSLPQAKQVYSHLLQHRTSLTGYLGDFLVIALASCGALEDALHASHALPCRTVFSWTAIISAFVNSGRPKEALDMYRCMLDDGVEPDQYTFVSLFKACSGLSDLKLGMILHEDTIQTDIISDIFVGNTLISMYGKCGNAIEAEYVFCTMPRRTVVSWNSMLSVFVEHAQEERALQLYARVQNEGLVPDCATFVISLQACTALIEKKHQCNGYRPALMALEIGQGLHAEILKKGLTSHIFVSSTLVSMYGKCRAIAEAQHVFVSLSHHDVVLWNVILSSYVEHGQGKEALQLYVQMQKHGIAPDTLSFVIAFQACVVLLEKQEIACLGNGSIFTVLLDIGFSLHSAAQALGFASDAFAGNTILSMYGKCGAIRDSEYMFLSMSCHDTVTWNAMLSAYVEQGEAAKALSLYSRMVKEGDPDQLTYVTAIRACSILTDTEEGLLTEGQSIIKVPLEIGRALHSEARRKGFASDEFVGSTLVTMYGKCGSLIEAEHMFDALAYHDATSWNTMISSYVEQGKGQWALHLYRIMQEENVSPDQITFMSSIQACTMLVEMELFVRSQSSTNTSFEIGKALHADAFRKGFLSHAFVTNTIVSMYGKCGAIHEAEYVFWKLNPRTTVSWNAILSAYVDLGEGEKALQLYKEMQNEGVDSDTLTYVIAFQACTCLAEKEVATCSEGGSLKLRALQIGRALHDDIEDSGFTSDVTVGNALVSMLGKCGAIIAAKGVFDALSQRTIVSWNAMLTAYVDQDKGEEALQLYKEMLKQLIILDHITPICVLQACSRTGSLSVCEDIHFAIISAGYDLCSLLAAPLINAYGSCAAMANGIASSLAIREPDIMLWNACISGCAVEGNYTECTDMFVQLNNAGIKPDEVTFISMISACSHAGFNPDGLVWYMFMTGVHDIVPDLKHYGAVVDLLGRAGDFGRVKNMLRVIATEADVSIWLCLLGACCTHANIELAVEAFQHAANLQPKDGALYVLMANIYANAKSFRCSNEHIFGSGYEQECNTVARRLFQPVDIYVR